MRKKILETLSSLWFPLLILLSFIVLGVRFAVGQNLEVKEAYRFVEIDQIKKAIEVMNKASVTYPTISSVWYNLGVIQLTHGQRDLAAESFEKGIALDQKEPLNYVGRGYISMLENNSINVELDFNKALSLSKSKNISVLRAVAEAYLVDNKFVAKALDLLLKAKSIDDHDFETFILLGDTYLAQNNGGLAVTSYEHAAALNEQAARPYYKIGLVYLRSRNFTAAQEAFNKSITIDPSYTLSYKELGELYYQLKEGPKAVKAYETYLSLTDKPELGTLRYAFFLFMAKDFPRANEIFARIVKMEDVSPITLRFYAFSLYESGDYQESEKVFEQYFLKSPQQEIEASDYAYYGKLLLKQNQDSLAAIQLQKSLALESNQPEILQLQAETFFKTKKYSAAIEAYEGLLRLRPKPVSQDLYTLGRAYYYNKEYEKAETVFQKLIDLQPNMTVGYLWEARAKSNLDPETENGLAKPYYEILIEKASSAPEKNKNDLMEAYSYLGYYHFLKQELSTSKTYWTKVLELNPNDLKAKEALKALR